MTMGERIIAWQRALHYGIGLGGGYKFLVFVSGVIIPVFAITGFLMWWIKRRNRRAGERAKAHPDGQRRGLRSRLTSAVGAACGRQLRRDLETIWRRPPKRRIDGYFGARS